MEALTLLGAFAQKVGQAATPAAVACDGHSGSLNVRDIESFVEQLGMNVPLGHFHGLVEVEVEVEACKIAELGQVDRTGTWEHLAHWHEGVQLEEVLVGKEEEAQAGVVGTVALVPEEDLAHTEDHNFLDHTSQILGLVKQFESQVLLYPQINQVPSKHESTCKSSSQKSNKYLWNINQLVIFILKPLNSFCKN